MAEFFIYALYPDMVTKVCPAMPVVSHGEQHEHREQEPAEVPVPEQAIFQSVDSFAFPAEMFDGEAPADDEDDRVRESRDERLKREALSLEHMTLHDRKNHLLSDKHWVRRGAEVVITEDVLSPSRPQDVLIAQLELLMAFQALVTLPDAFRFGTGVWYIDSIAALMSLVRGQSDNPDLERMPQMFHLALFHLHCGFWFEWAQSKSTFTCHHTRVVAQLWQPTFPFSKVFSCLECVGKTRENLLGVCVNRTAVVDTRDGPL